MSNGSFRISNEAEAEIERRVQERMARLLTEGSQELAASISTGVEEALRRVLSDEAVRKQFWRDGYNELQSHVGSDVSRWIAKRIINFVLTAALVAAVSWAALTGKFK